MGDAEDTLRAAERVVMILVENGVGAVVIGGVALAAHRYLRFTEDVDLGVDADIPQMKMLTAMLRVNGFVAEFHEPDCDDPLGGVIDISGPFGLVQVVSFANRFPAVIQDALEASDTLIRPGSVLRVVPIAQLVALKLYTGDMSSKSDIIELLRRNPEADLEAIRQTCVRYRLRGLAAILKELE
jgi:hypothetical protein